MEAGLRTIALSGSGTYGFQILAHWYQVSKSKEVAPWMPLPNPQPKMCVYMSTDALGFSGSLSWRGRKIWSAIPTEDTSMNGGES